MSKKKKKIEEDDENNINLYACKALYDATVDDCMTCPVKVECESLVKAKNV